MEPKKGIDPLYPSRNAHDHAALRTAHSEWGSFVAPGGLTLRGRDHAADFDLAWLRAFPDLRITIERVTSGGASVVVEGNASGTQLGPLRLLDHEVAPLGRPVRVPFCVVYTVEE